MRKKAKLPYLCWKQDILVKIRKDRRRINSRIDFYGLMKLIFVCPVPRTTGRGKFMSRWRSEAFRDDLSKQ